MAVRKVSESPFEEIKAPEAAATKPSRDFFGSGIGLVIFALGIGLLGLTFKLAYDLFTTPPERALKLSDKKALDLGVAGDSAATLFLRIALLFVMAAVGSLIANRGIALYCGSRQKRD